MLIGNGRQLGIFKKYAFKPEQSLAKATHQMACGGKNKAVRLQLCWTCPCNYSRLSNRGKTTEESTKGVVTNAISFLSLLDYQNVDVVLPKSSEVASIQISGEPDR